MSHAIQGPTIAEFYRGTSVLVTGATGFMGKVLLEKLLRSCPDIKHVYTIMRSKKGKSPQDRLKAIFQLPLYEVLNQQQPDAINKVIPVNGDLMEIGLGLSQEDRHILEQEVSVVFHVAATVKFDDPIKSAIFMNVRGTRDVMELASNMKNLKVLLHVSTTYCNTDIRVIEERLYPAPGDWRKMIRAAETLDDGLLTTLTAKILGIRPNTYTYTKALGEHVVDEYKQRLPIVIFRPSIVISAWKEPISGWMDNFNGPVGLMVAGGKGLLRTVYAAPENRADFMAVDIAIKAMIIASWDRATRLACDELPVYNCSTYGVKSINISDILTEAYNLAPVCPLNDSLWLPGGCVSRLFLVFYVKAMLMHILPAVCIDMALKTFNGKPMLLRLQRRIYIANIALEYFLHHDWQFMNKGFLELDTRVLKEDREAWGFDFSEINIREYLRSSFIGGREYLLKEDAASIPRAMRHFKRMYWLDRVVRTLFFSSVAWYVYQSSMLEHIFQGTNNFLTRTLLEA